MKLPELESVEVATGPHGETMIQRFYESGGVHEDTLDARTAEVIRNHFQQERDQELGRWRDPENPDLVCYLAKEDSVYVFNERAGDRAFYWLRDSLVARLWLEGAERDSYDTAGRYFKAHPNPKPQPWHAAAPGEVLVITVDGEELLCRSDSDGDFTPVFGHHHWVTIANGSRAITAGRRIWPEAAVGTTSERV